MLLTWPIVQAFGLCRGPTLGVTAGAKSSRTGRQMCAAQLNCLPMLKPVGCLWCAFPGIDPSQHQPSSEAMFHLGRFGRHDIHHELSLAQHGVCQRAVEGQSPVGRPEAWSRRSRRCRKRLWSTSCIQERLWTIGMGHGLRKSQGQMPVGTLACRGGLLEVIR